MMQTIETKPQTLNRFYPANDWTFVASHLNSHRRPRELREHLRDAHRVVARVGATLGRCEPAQAQDIEDGGAFVNASKSYDEMAAAFRWGAAAGTFGDIEHDAQGCSFKLITQIALALFGKKIHYANVELQREMIDIQRLV